MLVVDLLHEFELGVWKAIFTHLLRLLDASKQSMVHELNRRSDSLKGLAISVCVDTTFSAIAKCLRLAVIPFDAFVPIPPR
jgi:hypothetical protein